MPIRHFIMNAETGIVSPSNLNLLKGIVYIVAHDKMYKPKEDKNNWDDSVPMSNMMERAANSNNQCIKPEINTLHHVPISTA